MNRQHETTKAPSLESLREKAKQVVVVATEKNKRLATIESCTGGLVAHLITEVPGSSRVLETGWVCYSNEAKMRFLGVPKDLLFEHGAVSEEVAKALAVGGRKNADVDHAVATTGIAGPTGATPGKPVGLMWCAVADQVSVQAQQVLARDLDRSATKQVFAQHALVLLLKELESSR